MTDPGQLEQSIDAATRWLRDTVKPHALLWLDIMHRRHRVEPFADAATRFDAVLTANPADASRMRIFRRLVSAAQVLDPADMQHLGHPSDLLIAYALYSDQAPLPDVYPAALARAVGEGGYYLTHALLAWVLIRDLGAGHALEPEFISGLYAANAALINDNPGTVSDLHLEAAGFLFLAEQGALLDTEFLPAVVQAQQPDGGWGSENASHWHSTVLGLLVLLEHRRLVTEGLSGGEICARG